MIHKDIKGVIIPTIGFGTYKLEGDDCVESVKDAIDIGYRHIDTAQAYGNEEQVGKAINESRVKRDEIFLTTKIWHENLKADKLNKSFEESLQKLNMEYVDLLLIHWPSPEGVPLEETLNAMIKLKESGKIKHIGVSNFTPKLLQKALIIHPDIFCNQVEYHPTLSQDEIMKICRENNMALTAYSPLEQGEGMDESILSELAEKYHKTEAQVTLRWFAQQDNVLVIPKASSKEHREQNFNIFDFELNQEEMEKIFELDRGERIIDPEFAPEWGH